LAELGGDAGEVLAEASDDFGDGAGADPIEAFWAFRAIAGFSFGFGFGCVGIGVGVGWGRCAREGSLDFGADPGAGLAPGAGASGTDWAGFAEFQGEEHAAPYGPGDAVQRECRGWAAAIGVGAELFADDADELHGSFHDFVEHLAIEFSVVRRVVGREIDFRLGQGGVERHEQN
jgi:hypothetical protein